MKNNKKEDVLYTGNENSELYSIPIVFKSGFDLKTNILWVLMIAFFTSPLYLPYGDSMRSSLKILGIFLSCIFLIFWLYIGVFKRIILSLTNDGITFKFIKTKLISWSDIEDIQIYTKDKNKMLGVILKEQNTFNNVQPKGSKDDPFDSVIPISLFSKINFEKLYNTICSSITNNQ